ncbi:hypothetical protein NBRC116590_03060 [Pelagimonas sp. KU-00592-HH]|uniref:hypothetical protein n=1 Tax=Pelagimonas sp. KU-00592-HH TaxID=3127651 RepID=UPI003102F41E
MTRKPHSAGAWKHPSPKSEDDKQNAALSRLLFVIALMTFLILAFAMADRVFGKVAANAIEAERYNLLRLEGF